MNHTHTPMEPDRSQREGNSIMPEALTGAEPLSQARSWGRLFWFFALLIGAFFLADAGLLWSVRRIGTSEMGVLNRVLTGKVNTDIVISGSSRALVHYDPREITRGTGLSAYNIGRNGSRTDTQVAILKGYLRKNTKPRLVIHNVDMHSLAASQEIYDSGAYVPYLHLPEIYDMVRTINHDAWKSKWLPLYGLAVEDMSFLWVKGLVNLALRPSKDELIQGYHPRHLEWTGDFARYLASNPDGIVPETDDRGPVYFEELMQVCANAGVPLILVYSPEYRELQQHVKGRKELMARYQGVADRHGVPFWDFSGSPLCERKELFYNGSHLNATGSGLFSQELTQRLVAHLGKTRNSPSPGP